MAASKSETRTSRKLPTKPLKIGRHTVERIAVGDLTLGKVIINKDVTVIFRLQDDGGGGGGGGSSCLACKISKISQCADLVCPEIKKKDPNASCADAINECVDLACRPSCVGATGLGGGMIIIA